MFGSILGGIFDVADEIVSPVTGLVEDTTGISSELQKDILASVAVSYVTGGILDSFLDD